MSIHGIGFLVLAAFASAQSPSSARPALASLDLLERAGVAIREKDPGLNLGYAFVTPAQEEKIRGLAHAVGKCGGYEILPAVSATASSPLRDLAARVRRDLAARPAILKLEERADFTAALAELKEENVRATVEWLSSYPSRYHELKDPNQHVTALAARLRQLLKNYPGKFTVEEISHRSTQQRSLRVHLEGKARPQEIVVLGGHLDSINVSWFGTKAPGADDNASGVADLIEALRVLSLRGAPERSVDFFFYAGEEAGLLGSAEIAQDYKARHQDVIAVLQLDMTLFPGAGELVLGSMNDFTSPWLRQYLAAINETYLHAKVVDDQCGYACSDHASWYRQGFPTLMPFESDFGRMNPEIHSENDQVNSGSNFRHALAFAKIALLLGLDLGNSTARAPL